MSRKVGDKAYKPTTWQIKFNLESIDQNGSYTLRIALSSATFSILEVFVFFLRRLHHNTFRPSSLRNMYTVYR